jgi:DNA-binding response OmpR family regulator
MYLQDNYKVTTTTDLEILKSIVSSSHFDMLIMDSEPSETIEKLVKELRVENENFPIIMTYVFNNQIIDFESKIRKYISTIFYKPFDLSEVSLKLPALMLH